LELPWTDYLRQLQCEILNKYLCHCCYLQSIIYLPWGIYWLLEYIKIYEVLKKLRREIVGTEIPLIQWQIELSKDEKFYRLHWEKV